MSAAHLHQLTDDLMSQQHVPDEYAQNGESGERNIKPKIYVHDANKIGPGFAQSAELRNRRDVNINPNHMNNRYRDPPLQQNQYRPPPQQKCQNEGCFGYEIFIHIAFLCFVFLIGSMNFSDSSPFQDEFDDLMNEFNSSFAEVSRLGDIDYMPLSDFSKAMWNATKFITDSKFELELILIKTNLPNEQKLQLKDFFDEVDHLFYEMSPLSDDARSHYQDLKGATRTFISDINRLKRMIQRTNYKGVTMTLGRYIKYIDAMKDNLHELGQQFVSYRQELRRYWKEAKGYKLDMNVEKDSITAKSLEEQYREKNKQETRNPFEALYAFIFDSFDDSPDFREQAKSIRAGFAAAEYKFDIIAQCLDESVEAIEGIKKYMSGIGKRLKAVDHDLKKVGVGVAELYFDRYKEKMAQTLDNVIERLEESETTPDHEGPEYDSPRLMLTAK